MERAFDDGIVPAGKRWDLDGLPLLETYNERQAFDRIFTDNVPRCYSTVRYYWTCRVEYEDEAAPEGPACKLFGKCVEWLKSELERTARQDSAVSFVFAKL